MGLITEKRMRHYVGADADKASIPAAGKSEGDSYHANDKGKQYYWDGANWKTGLGYEYVPRLTNAWDKGTGDFTTDGTAKVNGLDLSAIVPAGAVGVVLHAEIKDDATDSYLYIYHSAAATISGIRLRTQVANLDIAQTAVLPIDTDRKLDYQGANLAFANIAVSVVGWFT